MKQSPLFWSPKALGSQEVDSSALRASWLAGSCYFCVSLLYLPRWPCPILDSGKSLTSPAFSQSAGWPQVSFALPNHGMQTFWPHRLYHLSQYVFNRWLHALLPTLFDCCYSCIPLPRGTGNSRRLSHPRTHSGGQPHVDLSHQLCIWLPQWGRKQHPQPACML